MYESFFGLSARPFELTADPRFFFETPQHREALTALRYGLEARKGLIVLTGEAGTGKTTVLRAAMAEQEQRGARIGYVATPGLIPGVLRDARANSSSAGVMQSKRRSSTS
jgi:type II secretory pathway predicted ATPase ExeA